MGADGQTVEIPHDVNANSGEISIENNQYGPVGVGGQNNDAASVAKKSSIIAAIMPLTYSSLYSYVGLLKALEYGDTRFRIVSGTGIAAYFAAFVANQGTSSLLEWNILKEYGDEVGHKYTTNNVENFNKVFSADENKKIEELTHLLFISIYNQKNKNIEFYNKGKIQPILKRALESGSERSLVFPVNVLKRRGADKVVAFVFEEQDFFKQKGEEYNLGQYNKMMTRVLSEQKKIDYLCKIKVNIATEKQLIIKQVYEQTMKCSAEINKMVTL